MSIKNNEINIGMFRFTTNYTEFVIGVGSLFRDHMKKTIEF